MDGGGLQKDRPDGFTLIERKERPNGFTLIELIAVVLILGLAMSLVVPNLSATRANRLKDEGRRIAHQLEVARQRAITSGIPHALYIQLEDGFVRVEWWVDEATAYPDLEVDTDAALALEGADQVDADLDLSGPIQMSPPLGDEPDFFPISGTFGRDTQLGPDYYFVGVESESGWFESGAAHVGFGPDGTAEFTTIKIADSWDNVIVLEVEPLLELVRVREDEDA